MLFCVETVWFDIVLFDDFIPRFLSNLALKRKGVNGEETSYRQSDSCENDFYCGKVELNSQIT